MKKYTKYLLIAVTLMFMGIYSVGARNAKKDPYNICEYNMSNGKMEVYTYDDGSTAVAIYNLKSGLGVDTENVKTYKNKNWTLKTCPSFIMYETKFNNTVYGSTSKSVLDNLVSEKNLTKYETVSLTKINNVSVDILINDDSIMKCNYDQIPATVYVDKVKKTVQVYDNDTKLCQKIVLPSYDDFETQCPTAFFKNKQRKGNTNVCTYSINEATYGKSDGSDLSSSINDPGSVDYEHYVQDVKDNCANMNSTVTLLKQVYNLIKYLIPVLIIGLSLVDFLKVVLNGDDKAFKETWMRFVKRLVVGVVILILPAILSLIINVSGVLNTYGIDDNNIFCIFV